jgi:hypothetical protein
MSPRPLRGFGATYSATVSRLLSLGMISESESRELLSGKCRRAAEQFSAVAGRVVAEDGAEFLEPRFRLKAEILRLAIECYRCDSLYEGTLRDHRRAATAPGTFDHQTLRIRAGRSLESPDVLSVLTHRLKGDTSPLPGLLPANAVRGCEPPRGSLRVAIRWRVLSPDDVARRPKLGALDRHADSGYVFGDHLRRRGSKIDGRLHVRRRREAR